MGWIKNAYASATNSFNNYFDGSFSKNFLKGSSTDHFKAAAKDVGAAAVDIAHVTVDAGVIVIDSSKIVASGVVAIGAVSTTAEVAYAASGAASVYSMFVTPGILVGAVAAVSGAILASPVILFSAAITAAVVYNYDAVGRIVKNTGHMVLDVAATAIDLGAATIEVVEGSALLVKEGADYAFGSNVSEKVAVEGFNVQDVLVIGNDHLTVSDTLASAA